MGDVMNTDSAEYKKDLDDDFSVPQSIKSYSRKAITLIAIIVCFLSVTVCLAVFLPVIFCVIIPTARSQGEHLATRENFSLPVSRTSNESNITINQIPEYAKRSLLDPGTWLDTTDFNTTFTSETVGNLSIMGLNDTYDDSVQANPTVPPLNQPFPYGQIPIRGVNLGGWLSIEPFITPSFFKVKNGTHYILRDELSLHQYLRENATRVIEEHYSTFVTKRTLEEVREAGLDHVRITFPFWILEKDMNVTSASGIGWRYLLRAIEWARSQGLRVNLDLHAAPGNQNSWNHGGYLGQLNWLSGPEGKQNANRTLKIHEQLSAFFSQDRYRNVVTIYGLLNEPNSFVTDPKLITDWHKKAYKIVRSTHPSTLISISDGFRGPGNWEKEFDAFHFPNVLIDAHRYTIFNDYLIALSYKDKLDIICNSWREEVEQKAKLPTIVGEWSLADTDCAEFLNNVGEGARWDGTFSPNGYAQCCPLQRNCTCSFANDDPANYKKEYRKLLYNFATAQIETFDRTWGWFYWNWDTQNATQWSYKKSRAEGLLPKLAYSTERTFNCSMLSTF
ncbi:glucan 1,3-beta-glucosidase Exg2 [Schizosaccharomyces cryophilus OY26]|uniref:glucan 1,3-beta-glucosidase n=1 Tax=Schizosaccharomyces cryophilus (strain OY26 / ATCC MYA-4695 / CBS 11777 / NBRC 106824 / NRRL Y48691) TaxID=653667 RepID=S9VW21_SCHCR|nr:glucan 1,3-beta-glucosidase Exg2 [Schizosaccharomyces cryophilus OY26]EPY50419.1 glucan 1,3-beta-glucosidase Exg2 [Schizosaccharomyces cryophilus OY26]